MGAETRLKEKNITLPQPATPVANYVGAVRVGTLLFVSGHGPVRADGKPRTRGKVGRELTVEQGYEVAREGGLSMLATVRASLGSLVHLSAVRAGEPPPARAAERRRLRRARGGAHDRAHRDR